MLELKYLIDNWDIEIEVWKIVFSIIVFLEKCSHLTVKVEILRSNQASRRD